MITLEFLRAGKAIFTVDNGKGTHYTFRINAAQDKYSLKKQTVYFVGILTGTDNLKDYTNMGRLSDSNTLLVSQGYAAGNWYKKQIAVLQWALKQIVNQAELPAGYEIRHAGHCCRCARTLTTPRSLDIGIGPECEKKMGMVA